MTAARQRQRIRRVTPGSGGGGAPRRLLTARRAAVAGASTLAAAVITWAVSYYLPGAVKHEGAPVLVNVQDDPTVINKDFGIRMVVPASVTPRSTPDPPGQWCDGFHEWGRRLGGVDRGETRAQVIVQGNTDKAVVITGMSAVVISRKPLENGVPVRCPTAAEAQIRMLNINLDVPNPAASYSVAGRGKTFGFDLKRGETEVFNITAMTKRGEVLEWKLRLLLTINGKSTVLEVLDRGAPFKTIGEGRGNDYTWTDGWSYDGAQRSPFA